MVSCKGNGGSDEKEVAGDGNKEESSSEDYFVWIDNKINGLTEGGKKQKVIIVPERCDEFRVDFEESEAIEIRFEGDKIVDLNGCLAGAKTVEKNRTSWKIGSNKLN